MILSIIYFILILGTIVLVHEFGHFFFAKLFGVYVYEFAIGMGPKLFSHKSKKSETTYSFRLIPIGGFCQLAGEGVPEDEKLPKEKLLQSKPVWQRFLIMFFGAGNNFILAILVLFLISLIWGAPSTSNKIAAVEEGSPVEVAGMLKDDKIIAINGNTVKTLDDLQLYLTISGEEETTFKILRDNKEYEFKVTPLKAAEAEEKGYTFGIQFENKVSHSFVSSIKYAFVKTWSLMRQLVITLKELFTGGVSINDLSGPVGIYTVVDQTRGTGFANILYLLALLCINVGFINLLPFPAFDGGRIVFLLIEKIMGKPVKAETENLIHNIGFFLLLGLIIYITIHDVLRLF